MTKKSPEILVDKEKFGGNIVRKICHRLFWTSCSEIVGCCIDSEGWTPLQFMYYTDCLSLSGFNIVLLRWSSGVSFAAPSLTCTFVTSAACPASVLAARHVLRSAAKGELLVRRTHLATVQPRAFSVVGPSAWNDLPVELYVPCWWPALPNLRSLLSPSSLTVTGLEAPLSNSTLKRRYISLRNEWMNEWMNIRSSADKESSVKWMK